ncbi:MULTISPECIES: LysR family transcriptional regulator [Burkholderiales]|uniref:LysR family transcriptional regulator n=1 Tax=Burkholderiales TaxID=80840 RepID=UPI0022DE7F81|nr:MULTISPECIES: LysR family transcriptional regulator [Burkholderiales]
MIELRHLRYFIAVAEELNFRRAAERIHIDQASLSRAIRDLEDQLDAPLFIRLPRKLDLTPAGLKLLKEAQKLLIRFEACNRCSSATDANMQLPSRGSPSNALRKSDFSDKLAAFAHLRQISSAWGGIDGSNPAWPSVPRPAISRVNQERLPWASGPIVKKS